MGGHCGQLVARTTLTFRRPSQSRIAVRACGTRRTPRAIATNDHGHERDRHRSAARTEAAVRGGPRIADATSGVGGNAHVAAELREVRSRAQPYASLRCSSARDVRDLTVPEPNVQRAQPSLLLGQLEEEAARDHEALLLTQTR